MPSTNGHGPKRAILYARVSTDEQVRSGYSLAQQMEALREYTAREGYEVLEEVTDPGQSGASLERPGMDRVRDLVASSVVSVVLAQDRDRFAREPAYLYLLRKEFEEHGTKICALNDRGDDSPEGQLTDGIIDQIARFERAKTAQRMRRGKMRKAREGKIIAGRQPDYGFKYNATRDGYEVDEEKMRIVRRIFYMVGVEGRSLHEINKGFIAQGVRTPTGKKVWSRTLIRNVITDDVYKPHTYQEVEKLVAPEVLARLDSGCCYGIWWFNRRKTKTTQISVSRRNGKEYKKQTKRTPRDREEWIAVPVPDSGVPGEWVDAARAALKDNHWNSNAGRRFWELSGGIMHCGGCGCAMVSHTTTIKSGSTYFYYVCRTRYHRDRKACTQNKHFPAAKLEAQVWEAVSGILKDPEQLRADLDAMIELERKNMRGNPDKEAQLWADKLAEVHHRRVRYQEMAADDLITLNELRARLTELDDTRKTAERELDALHNHREYLDELEQDRDVLLESLVDTAPDALDELTLEERRQVYKMLRLKVRAYLDGPLEVSGAFSEGTSICDSETLSRRGCDGKKTLTRRIPPAPRCRRIPLVLVNSGRLRT